MIEKTGCASIEQIKSCFPQTLSRNGKAIIECYEEIPCNPCSTSCPFGAITIAPNLNQRPKLNLDRCTGCGICVYSCPGLAIMVAGFDGKNLSFKIPYEFSPLPKAGEMWSAVDRTGKIIGEAEIQKVSLRSAHDRTALVQVGVNADLLYQFAGIKVKYE
ncbi:MAG: 4Fe-4S binding protein [Bacilli bacterium]|nr:4Fe-4S binding protein [Bacilli bacterium]